MSFTAGFIAGTWVGATVTAAIALILSYVCHKSIEQQQTTPLLEILIPIAAVLITLFTYLVSK